MDNTATVNSLTTNKQSLVNPSEIILPVTVSLSSLVNIADIESRIPVSEDFSESWKEIPKPGSGKAVRYKWERDSFSVTAYDSTLVISTELRYQIKYAQRAKQPWPFTNYTWITIGSCGYNEPMRRVRLTLTSNLSIQPDWRLHSSTNISTDFIDKCEATILHYDVTEQIKKLVDEQLSNTATILDEQIPRFTDVRVRAEELWQKMIQPIAIDTNLDLWLSIQPNGIQFTRPILNNAEISFAFYLRSEPLITLGKRPEPSKIIYTEIQYLKPDTGFHIELLLNLTYKQAAAVLRQRFGGASYTVSGNRTITIDSIDIFGDENITTLSVDLHGDLDGQIRITGKPTFDSTTNTIALSDLDYSISTNNLFFKISDWWSHKKRVAELQQKAKWEITGELQLARDKLNALLFKSNYKNMEFFGSINSLHGIGITPANSAIICAIEANGNLQVRVK